MTEKRNPGKETVKECMGLSHREKMELVRELYRLVELLAEHYRHSHDSWALLNRARRLLERLVRDTRRKRKPALAKSALPDDDGAAGEVSCKCCGRRWAFHCGGTPDRGSWKATCRVRRDYRRRHG